MTLEELAVILGLGLAGSLAVAVTIAGVGMVGWLISYVRRRLG